MYDNGRVPVPATFMSSPVAFDDKILLTSEEGDTFVVKAGTFSSDSPDEFDWRACLCFPGSCVVEDFHPRRKTSLLHWENASNSVAICRSRLNFHFSLYRSTFSAQDDLK